MLTRNIASLVEFKKFPLPVLIIKDRQVRSQLDTLAYNMSLQQMSRFAMPLRVKANRATAELRRWTLIM